MCVHGNGLNPNNSGTYEAILNLITYLKGYCNLLSEERRLQSQYLTKIAEMFVLACGLNPNNSATYEAILNLITYLKWY